jgi:hypothetical protein
MQEVKWERCPYLAESRCPYRTVIERAYLFPQILDAAEIEEAERICDECGEFVAEKGKYTRIKRPSVSYRHKRL